MGSEMCIRDSFSPSVMAAGENTEQMLVRYGPTGISGPERPVADVDANAVLA